MSVGLEVLDEPARSCSAMLLSAILDGGHVVLTGGSTPGRAYEQLAAALKTAGRGLGDATIWFGDERCVPPDDELSNFGLAQRTLLDPLGEADSDAVKRIEGELGSEQAAQRYEQELRQAGAPPFDLLLLGLGPDGHIASLFPDQESLSERSRLVVGVPEAGLEPFVPRVSLTLPAIADSEQIVFLVSGEAKADAVAAAFGAHAKPDPHVPASMLPPLAAEIKVLLDPAAASKL